MAPLMQLLICFLGLAVTVLSSDGNGFTSPNGDNGPVIWEIGSNQIVSWDSTVQVFNVSFWQSNPATSNYNILSLHDDPTQNINTVSSMNWTVQIYDFDLSTSQTFFFWVNYGAESAANWTSVPFNITASNNSSSTTSNSTLSSSSSLSSSSNSSNILAIGLGVGLGVGIPILGLLSFIAYMLLRRQRAYAALHTPESREMNRTIGSASAYSKSQQRRMDKLHAPGYTAQDDEWAHELPAPELRGELPSS